MKKEIFRMERITYKEHEIIKLEDFNLHLFEGEIMGMIPINSFGLSTFLVLLKRNLPLYDGYVYYQEKLVNSWKGADKNQNRITVIQNKSCLVERMTVLDNIFVLRQGFRQQMIRDGILEKQLEPFLKDIDVEIEAMSYVEKLSIFQRMIVELLKGIIAGHKLIVLKDIESLITGEDLKKFYFIIQHYAKKGYAFLYISSHLEDIKQICSRVAILSNGRIEKILQEHEMIDSNLEVLTEKYGTLMKGYLRPNGKKSYKKYDIFKMHCQFREDNLPITFEVYQGECLAIQCVDSRIYESIISLEHSYMEINGKKEPFYRNYNIGIIQEFPTKTMLFPEFNYMENLCFNLDHRMSSMFLRDKIRKSIYKEYSTQFGTSVFDCDIENLTEKQKYQLIYERIILQKPKIVFCIQPFRGVDLEHRIYIGELIKRLLEKGISVIVLAINRADALAIADRLICIDQTMSRKVYDREEFDEISTFSTMK